MRTITAIIDQQTSQIGVLKAIGTTREQILQLYYTTVLVYGLAAMVLSIPLAVVIAHVIRVAMMGMMGMNVGSFEISLPAALIQAAICLFAPLLIATFPIFKGAGITVREAISNYGLSGGANLIDRLLAKLTLLPRMTSMAVLIAIVGGIALSGTLSINVLERRTEIGILRSIGASNSAIGMLFITEGILMGWISWLVTIPFSVGAGYLLNFYLGAMIQTDLVYDYSETSV